jgi:hypothetical protein
MSSTLMSVRRIWVAVVTVLAVLGFLVLLAVNLRVGELL